MDQDLSPPLRDPKKQRPLLGDSGCVGTPALLLPPQHERPSLGPRGDRADLNSVNGRLDFRNCCGRDGPKRCLWPKALTNLHFIRRTPEEAAGARVSSPA